MKNLITYLKALWSWVSGSQRKKIGVTLGEAAIEHPFSTYSAPFGICWQPSGKLHSVVRCAAVLVMLFTIGSGNVWGAEGANHDFSQTISHSLNNGYEPDDITIAEQSYTIKEVIITYSSNKSSKFSASVSVNGNDWGTKSWTKTTNTTTYTTISYKTSPQTSTKGAVTISFTNTAGSSETGQGTLSITNVRLVEGASAAPAYTITAQSNNNSYGTVSLSGTTITATPNSGYRVMSGTDGYTVTSGTATVVNNGDNTFTVTPSSNCTVRINFESKGCMEHYGTNVTSGTATDASTYGPVHSYYNYGTRQILYTKTDLGLAAGKKGTIKSIYFEYAGAAAMAARTVKIYMANTALTALSTSAFVPYSSFSEVYSGTFSCATAGWYEITLDTPFDYNGFGNLVVLIDDNTGSYESSKYFKYHTANTTTGAQIHKENDSSNENPATTDWSTYTATNNRPNTKFCIQEADMTPATVTLMDNGATITEVSAGVGVTLPSRAGCTGYTFAGWTKTWVAPQSSWTTTAPTIIPAGSYTPTADENLYPVYTKTEGGGSPEFSQYQQVALGGTITAGKYLISTGSYTMAGSGKTGVSLTPGTTEAAAREYTVAIVSGTTITIKGPDNKYIGGLDKADGLTFSTTTPSSDDYRWVYTENGIQNKSITGRHIKAYSTTDFRHYGTGNGTLTYFYKRIETSGSTTSYISVPNCCTDPGLNYGTGSVTKTYGADAFTNTLTNSHSVAVTYSSSDPTVATVNGSGQVTILKAGSTTITASSAAQTVAAVSYCADEASYTLTVNKANISPTLSYDPASVTVGSTLTSFTLSGNSGSGSVSYSSSNDAIATVNSSGVVTGVAPGTVTITATIAATTNYNGNTATSNTITVNAAACIGVNSLHTGNKDQGGWVTNQCFEDADWGAADDAIYVGAFPLTNECYVGWAGGGSYYGTNWAVGGIKTYDIPTGRTLGWNSGNYYESYPGGALGTFHIYKNSTDENYYLRFKPSSYILRTGSDGTSWTSREMTVSATNSHYYETAELDLTSTLISEHAYVDLKTSGGDGHVWCNFSNDRTASGNVKVKSSTGDADGNFRGDNLKASDNGTHGKFRIDITKDVDNWKLAFVPMYRITYAAGTGALGSMDPSSYAEISTTIAAAANGFTAPTGKQFNGWSDGINSYAAGANVTMNSNVTLTAQWTDIDYTVTVSQSPDVSATTTGQTSSAHYNGTINLTTTVPDGYRFVNWTSSDVTITNPTSATTASFTMPAKNVTVTANFQQTHKVDWYVGGSAPANKIGDDGQTTVVDHGGKISNFPAHDPDGSACDKEFVGWTNTSSYVHGTSPLFNDVAGSPTINADANFYAVFATGGGDDFELVTAVSQLHVGDVVTIANFAGNSASGAVIKAYNSGNNWPQASATTDASGKISGSTTDMQTFTLEEGSVDDTWAFNDGTGYPYAASSGSNHMKRETTLSGNSSFAITIDGSTSVATIVAQGDYTRNVMQYNSSSNLFACYGSASQASVYLYKKPSYTGHTITCADCGTSVTVSYSAPGNGNTMTVTKSAAAVASGTVIKTCSAQELTITLTPATHYTADGLTATGVAGVTTSNVGNVYTVTIPAAGTGTLTLTPTFTPETPLSITFIPTVSGTTVGSIGTIYSGDNFDFPSVSNLPVGFCADFLGWVDFTNGETFDGDGTRTTAPSELITAGTNSGAMTANKIYKAVYGESETSEAEGYFKVTAAPEAPATWANDHYLIVYEGDATHDAVAFKGSLSTLDAVKDTAHVTITAGVIAYSAALAACEFKIAAITGGYSIQSASGVYIGKAAYSNGMDESTSDAAVNTLSYTSGATVIAGAGGCVLNYNYASDQLRFRYYKTGQQDIQLYKYGTAPVVTYTYTTAPSCGTKYRVTVASVSGGSPAVSPKYCADGTTVSLVANANNGYTFTSWTITKDADDSNVTSTLLTGDKQTTANTTFEMPAYDITVTATYTIINYNITYNNLNGATNSNPATYNVASADIDFVAPGARAGYIFKGWYDDAIYTNQVTGIPNGSTGAVTVYVKWAVGYTITWDNAIGSNPASTGVEEGNAIGTLPIPSGSCTFDGTTYSNFVGWYTGTISSVGTAASDAGDEITSATIPTANATYHAVYTNLPDYSGTNTSNVTLPEVATPKENVKVKVDDADDAPEYDGIKIGTNSTKTSSFTFTVPAGTTKITLQGVAWSGKTASVTLSTSVGTISPSTAQSLASSTGASDRSPFTITSNTTLTFNLTNVNSTATITVANSNERVIVWGINASSASGSSVGYITQCCDNVMAAPTMNAPTVRTSTAITLSWNTVTNATGYKVSWNGGDWEDVATATTYEKTSLEPGTDYSYKVIAKYTSPYCGASVYEGVVSTKPVFTVIYQGGSGTGTCTADHVPTDANTYEEGATVTLPPTSGDGNIHLTGNSFAAWSSEQVALTAESTTFTMPAENVTVTATWTANQDKYYDNMHNLTATDPATGDPGTADGAHYYIVREGCNYTVPSLTNSTTGDTDCHTTHYVLMGWAAAGHIHQTGDNAGQVISGHESYVFTGGGTKSATGATYYAIWAIVE